MPAGRQRLFPDRVLTPTERGRRFRAKRAGLDVPPAPKLARPLDPVLSVADFGNIPTMDDVFAALATPPADRKA